MSQSSPLQDMFIMKDILVKDLKSNFQKPAKRGAMGNKVMGANSN
jgi:hypothetical protein